MDAGTVMGALGLAGAAVGFGVSRRDKRQNEDRASTAEAAARAQHEEITALHRRLGDIEEARRRDERKPLIGVKWVFTDGGDYVVELVNLSPYVIDRLEWSIVVDLHRHPVFSLGPARQRSGELIDLRPGRPVNLDAEVNAAGNDGTMHLTCVVVAAGDEWPGVVLEVPAHLARPSELW